MERILPDDIVQRIIDFKSVKETTQECHLLWRQYYLANETATRQIALAMFNSETSLDLSGSMQMTRSQVWKTVIEDTLEKSIKAQTLLIEWIDAKRVCEAALLKIA